MNRETLREFSITVFNDRSDKYVIHYGYDLSMTGAEFYVKASINDSEFSATKKTLDRVRKLNIPAINKLISLIGCDETGLPQKYSQISVVYLQNYVYAKSNKKSTHEAIDGLIKLIGLTSDSEISKLEATLNSIYTQVVNDKHVNAVNSFVKYINSHRLERLLNVRETIQAIRQLHFNGVDMNNKHSSVRYEGFLKSSHYPVYYKRDMDLVRISRIRIHKMLGKKYTPVA